jgi:oligo-1,6-glucosidase
MVMTNLWWQDAVVYQIYPKSFKDSNNDGIGDIKGIISKPDYLKDLGVDVLWLCPVYRSPEVDNGYDISDYLDINPKFGTMEDMDRLIRQADQRGMKIIMDLVINHTSDRHPWFLESKDKTGPYRNYYYWREDDGKGTPSNWTGFFGGKTRSKDPDTGDWYLHLFSKEQPDLNWHHPAVMEEIKSVMKFWPDKGIAGFRYDVINVIWKDSLENGRFKLILKGSEHYLSRPGSHEILKALRKDVLSRYDCFTVGETVFITPEEARKYTLPEKKEPDMIFYFEHMETDQILVKWFKRKFRPERLFKTLIKWQKELPWNANYLENHDRPRSVSRFGNVEKYWRESAKMPGMLLMTLRGTPFLYQGQELGMTGFVFHSMEDIKDVESIQIEALAKKLLIPEKLRKKIIFSTSRDHARTPFQWSDQKHAGFSESTPWIKVNRNYVHINQENQSKDPASVLAFYKRLIAFRKKSTALKEGSFTPLYYDKKTFIYERNHEQESLLVLLNFSDKPSKVKYAGECLLSNYNRKTFDGMLHPWEGILLSTTPR